MERRDRRLLGAADLIVINGLGMEPWLERALTRSAIGGKVVECSAGLDVRLPGSLMEVRARKPGPTDAASEGVRSAEPRAANPHVWLDPLLACHMVTNILLALEKADPVHASSYESNALEYVARLQGLHEEIRRALEPYRGSSIVTYHDAFAYFARRYGLNVAGVIEEGIEPSPRHLTALRQAIQREKVKVIFSEASHPGKLAVQLGRDLGIQVAVLDSLESGPARPAAYEEGMRRNLSVLERFLP